MKKQSIKEKTCNPKATYLDKVKELKKLKEIGNFRRLLLVIFLSQIIMCGGIAGILGYAYMSKQTDTAVVVMTLNYENSTSGLNPDNSKFNLRFLKGEDVLLDALESTDMLQRLTPKELASFIKIKGVSSKPIDVNSDVKYIDSTYKITLTLPREYSEFISAKKMLGEICDSYSEWFVSSYVIDSKALEINTDNFKNMEYSTISSYLDLMALRGKNYLQQKEESTVAFTGSDGTTWKSLRQELSNLTEYDIATFNQYIWENGIAKDKDWAVTVLKHKSDDLNIDYTLYLANVSKYKGVVTQYRNEMTSSVLIPTYDELGQFYMSRTKTGIDDISKSMDQYLGDATTLKEKIDTNSDKIAKLENSTYTSTEKADIMLQSIQTKLVDIFERIKKLDAEYVSKKTSGYVQYEFVDSGFSIPFL